MTLIGKTWTVDTLRAELADLEKQKNADVFGITRGHKETRNEQVQDVRQLYRFQRKKLIAALDVLLAESSASGPTPSVTAEQGDNE